MCATAPIPVLREAARLGMQSSIQGCNLEPIHALGLIQGHGALIAFDRAGCVVARSLNATSLLGPVPNLGEQVTSGNFDQVAREAISRGLQNPELSQDSVQCAAPDHRRFDLVMHWSDGLLLVEWESKPSIVPPTTHYANFVQQSIQQLQRSAASSLEQLLQVATDAIRSLTGFDRVMAYRFLPDGSGSVSAESRRAQLAPYLHLRYPAGDIPAQARRLYVLNPIRHIADVAEAPVAIETTIVPAGGTPLNLTYSTLRSVSPIHIEYLKNMGVAASMSVSIVVNDKLWGLIACHHMEPLSVPHAVRLSCTVLAQVLSITVERNELSQRAAAESRIEGLRGHVASALASADDATAGLLAANEAMRGLIACDALSVLVGQRVGSFPSNLDRAAAIKVADYLSDHRQDLLVTESISRDVPELAGLLTEANRAPGVLAIQLSGMPAITIIWWRAELVETVHWAGQPAKITVADANGEHLRPRKSFELWKETVRGSSRAWDATDRFAARELKVILQEVALNHMRVAEHERAALLAIMGHDLRDPLQAIDMVVTLMGRGLVSGSDGAKRIEYSSQRMQSLIAYILDVSRLRTGVGLAMDIRKVSLTPLLYSTFERAQQAHPGVEMTVEIGELGDCLIDGDRLVQAISNLLSNARHHGDMRFPIKVSARRCGDQQIIEVTNRIPVDATFAPGSMTSPFNVSSSRNARNKAGLGLGLYIAKAIAKGLGGALKADRVDDDARFTIVLNDRREQELLDNDGLRGEAVAVRNVPL
jgi:chemotaxis family two-component system sensor kinase Cph1